jgi:predicted RNA binding protein YcfA (HicA-like mRNA interferase family)
MNAEQFKRSPLILADGRGGGRFKSLTQGEFDWVMSHHGFEKQTRSGGADHDKYTHSKTGKVISVKPRRDFFHDILERISKNVAKETNDPHLRHHSNWDPAFLRKGGRAELAILMTPEQTEFMKIKTEEAKFHNNIAYKYILLSKESSGEKLPAGINQIRGLRIAAINFKKAAKASACIKLSKGV